jgi:alpha-galactosidase
VIVVPGESLVTPPEPPVPDVHLSDLKPLKAVSGWGTVQMNKSVTQKALRTAGREWPKGVGVHARSELEYECRPEYARFVATVGLDEGARGHPACLDFAVYADDAEIARSPLLRWEVATVWHLDAAIPKDTRRIRLVVGDGGDHSWDHADWVNAGFVLADK